MPRSATADVIVVGAGPAGTAAAITLARAGRRVTVVDKATFPRDKTCGDGLTSAALRHLEHLGMDPTTIPSWQPLDGVMVRTPNGSEQHFDLPPGAGQFAAVARRCELDATLVDLARRAGAEVVEGTAVTGVTVADGTVEVALSDGTSMRAWYAIGADGMWSPLRKLLGAGAPGYLGDWHAVRQYFRATGPEARKMWVWFEADLRPGYAWSFPLPGDRVNIGFGIHRQAGSPTGSMKALWAELLTRPHVARVLGPAAEADEPWQSWPIPTRIGATPLSAAGGRVLFAGDAARAGDTMTGEGIAQALESARAAANAVLGAGAGAPARAARTYRWVTAAGLYADDLVSRAITHTLARHPRASDEWLPVALATGLTTRYFGPWMFEHHPRSLPLTPWRWRRGALSASGAWSGLAGLDGRGVRSTAWQTSASTAR